jgi:hypothetical protein
MLRLPEECVTPQERELLTQLTQRINQTTLQEKDPDAENLLGRELGANPDALYILAQTVLVQDIALQQARGQVSQLQQQLEQARQPQQPQHSTSFLGRLLGDRDPQPAPSQPQQPASWQQPGAGQQQGQQPAWGQQPSQQPPFQPVQFAPQQPPYGVPQYVQPAYGAPVGQPSFLRGAMQTAAGVAAGALAFEGVESILHGFGHGGGMGMAGMGMSPGFGMGGAIERPVEETVINNYYDQPGTQGGGERRFDQDNLRGFDDTPTRNEGGREFASGNPAGQQNYTGPDEMALNEGQGSGYTLDDSQDGTSDYDVSQDISQDDGGGFDDGGGDDSSSDSGF